MKKLFFAVVLFGGMLFATSTGYDESTTPVKEFPNLYAVSCNAP
jgi:hypothetical protein